MGTKFEKLKGGLAARTRRTAANRLSHIGCAAYLVAYAKERLSQAEKALEKAVKMGETAIKNARKAAEATNDADEKKLVQDIEKSMQRRAADQDGYAAKKAKKTVRLEDIARLAVRKKAREERQEATRLAKKKKNKKG